MPDLAILKQRSEILRRIRAFFDAHAFFEVQTPILSRGTMIDEFIDPVEVNVDGVEDALFMQTSPEFEMKRLLMEGCEAIFQITPVFRSGESGKWHNPEFTMLEWYRVGDDYQAGLDFLREFTLEFFSDREVRFLTYENVFQDAFQIDPHNASGKQLRELCTQHHLTVPATFSDEQPDPWLQYLMSEVIEPKWGPGSAVVLYDWPESQAALAKKRTDTTVSKQKVVVAERFELYVDGIELANGYHELCDPVEHQTRLAENNRRRAEQGKKRLPENSKFMEDLQSRGLPGCCGVAVGIDRMIAVLTGVSSLRDVQCFTIDDV